jgi:hypothetical protein
MRIESLIFMLTGSAKPAQRHWSGRWNRVSEPSGNQRVEATVLRWRLVRLKYRRSFDVIDGDQDEFIHRWVKTLWRGVVE